MPRTQFFSLLLLFALLSVGAGFAAFSGVENPKGCEVCGMDRVTFASSRVMITYDNKSVVGTCSINCAHSDVTAKKSLKVLSIRVADRDTRELVDARKAFWVIGGSKHGVMTATPKWAFADRRRAEAFIRAYGGKLAGFEAVWLASAD